jgi:hypothetical protein
MQPSIGSTYPIINYSRDFSHAKRWLKSSLTSCYRPIVMYSFACAMHPMTIVAKNKTGLDRVPKNFQSMNCISKLDVRTSAPCMQSRTSVQHTEFYRPGDTTYTLVAVSLKFSPRSSPEQTFHYRKSQILRQTHTYGQIDR